MNNTEKQFIELLSKSIRNDKNIKKYEDVNWSNLLNIATDHNVEGIIYSILSSNKNNLDITDEILERMKAFAFYTGISQVRKITYLDNIFKCFENANIPVIALKGIILRNFYPEPAQRSMYDADILVHKEDLPRITDVLKSIGYNLENEDLKVYLKFTHRLYPIIKVHWGFIDGEETKDYIWENIIKSNIINIEIITLGYEDFILHLCHNMVQNMNEIGLNLRQISDLVLFVEANKELVDWSIFRSKAKEQGIDKFVLVSFALCRNLLNMELPEVLVDRDIIYSPNIDILIEDILLGKTFGDSDNKKGINMDKKNNNHFISMIKNIVQALNPKNEAKFNEDYNFRDNIKLIYKGIKISNEKNNMIKWLDI